MTETAQDLIAAYRLDEAREPILAACEHSAAEHGSDSPEHTAALLQLGRWHLAAGEYAAAEPLLKQALHQAQRHAAGLLPAARQAQAALWNETGRFDQTAALLAQIDNKTPAERIEYGTALAAEGSLKQALAQYETAAAERLDTHGMEHADTAYAYLHAAAVYRMQGYPRQALSVLSGCLNILRRHIGKHHPHTAAVLMESAAACEQLNDFGRAGLHYRQAEQALLKSLGSAHPLFARATMRHGYFLAARGKTDEALLRLQQALNIYTDTFDSEHPLIHTLIRHIALLLMQRMAAEE